MEHAISIEIAQLKERINESINSLEAKHMEIGLEMEAPRQIKGSPELDNLLVDVQESLEHRLQIMHSIVKIISTVNPITLEEINLMDNVLSKITLEPQMENELFRLVNIQNKEESDQSQ